MSQAAYIKLYQTGRLREIHKKLLGFYDDCCLCPRLCHVNRNNNQSGICSAGNMVKISSVHPHFGEENPLVGRRGSGTIFFSNCNLLCCFCQNWEISHLGEGKIIEDKELAQLMIRLQEIGCHNINLVTPTPYLPNIMNALNYAAEDGLSVPIVYNSSGYERSEIIQLLAGIVDIYLPDFKYADRKTAAKYCQGAEDYPDVARQAVKEMHLQVGILKTDERGIARRGLMIRHLVLPNNQAGTEEFLKFVALELDSKTYVNIMNQYHPEYQAMKFSEISRGLTIDEYNQAISWARKYGLSNLD